MNKALQTFIVKEESLLIDFLINNIKDKSKNNIKNMIINNYVFVNKKRINKCNYITKKNDEIVVIKRKINNDIDIIYEDDYLIGINKPSGLLSVSDNKGNITAYNMVSSYTKEKNKSNKIFVLHRLDRDTSGILLYEENPRIVRGFY